MRRALILLLAVGLGTSTLPVIARADPALAETLFVRGKQLMDEGKLDEACEMLAESHRLDASGGSILALALCHEAQGKTATAWADYEEALARAEREGNPARAEIARGKRDELAPKVVRLVFRVDENNLALDGFTLTRSGALVPRVALALPVPVDPGVHSIVASAPGHVAHTVDIRVDGAERELVVEIPRLTKEPPTPLPPPVEPVVRVQEARLPQWPWFVGGAAFGALSLGGFALGGGALAHALNLREEANARCPSSACADPGAIAVNQQAGVWADVATGAFIGGGIAAAVSVAAFVVPFVVDVEPSVAAIEVAPGFAALSLTLP